MKKIFGNIRTLAALLIASATLAACSTEDSVMTDEKAPQVYTLTIDASMDGGAQTRALEFEGTKLVAKWANDETVDVRRGGTPLGTLTVSNVSADGQTCTLSGTLTGSINKHDALRFYYNFSGTLVNESQTGTLSSTAASDYAMAAVTVKSVNGGNITLESEPSFLTQVAVLKITMQDALANKLNATSLKIKIGDKDLCTLSPSTTAYSENGDGVVYFALPSAHRVYTEGISSIGLDEEELAAATVTFTATAGGNTYIATKTGYSFVAGKYYATTLTMAKVVPEAVDLGLPSGTLWANMNVGATSEGDYGDFFAWGETEPYYSSQSPSVTWKTGKTAGYEWASYQWTTDGGSSFTKYTDSNSATLESTDDAATAKWGSDWRMPTKVEFQELLDNTNKQWVDNYNNTGVSGYKFTSKTDASKSIFLPAAGWRNGTSLYDQGSGGYYWSSTLDEGILGYAWDLYFTSGDANVSNYNRYNGYTVRPVKGAATPAVPDGAISGQFTINSSGDKVFFSKGNLQYTKSTSTWSFMENQYSTVETFEQNVGNNYANQNVVSLFGWGTSGKTFASGYGTAYQPYATSYTITAYGPSDGTSGLTGTYADGDWGVNIGSGWRTLSSTEWEYLFGTNSSNKRTTTSNLYFAKATVNSVPGVILLPDDWSTSYYDLISANSRDAAFTVNQISSSDWSSKLESHGCVFLPAAGDRGSTTVINVGSRGYYWSSTANGTDSAYYVYFVSGSENGGVAPASSLYRRLGFSVRLVHDVE